MLDEVVVLVRGERRPDDLDEVMLDWVRGPDFDRLLVDTVRSTFPAHEHDHFVEHYRGLLGMWMRDEENRLSRV